MDALKIMMSVFAETQNAVMIAAYDISADDYHHIEHKLAVKLCEDRWIEYTFRRIDSHTNELKGFGIMLEMSMNDMLSKYAKIVLANDFSRLELTHN